MHTDLCKPRYIRTIIFPSGESYADFVTDSDLRRLICMLCHSQCIAMSSNGECGISELAHFFVLFYHCIVSVTTLELKKKYVSQNNYSFCVKVIRYRGFN